MLKAVTVVVNELVYRCLIHVHSVSAQYKGQMMNTCGHVFSFPRTETTLTSLKQQKTTRVPKIPRRQLLYAIKETEDRGEISL